MTRLLNWQSSYKKNYRTMSNSLDATGDVVTGDEVTFERAVFKGSYRNPKFSHNETISGIVTKDSYGAEKQQHTFTILKDDGETIRIKGRNLYRNGVTRKQWIDEGKRREVAEAKHSRGDSARAKREQRLRNSEY